MMVTEKQGFFSLQLVTSWQRVSVFLVGDFLMGDTIFKMLKKIRRKKSINDLGIDGFAPR